MMIYSFIEWVQGKEEMLIDEASRRGTMNRSLVRDSSGPVHPRIHDLIVFNGNEVLRLAKAKEDQKYSTKFSSPFSHQEEPENSEEPKQNITQKSSEIAHMGMIRDIEGSSASIQQMGTDHVPTQVFIKKGENFRDITDAFQEDPLPPNARVLMFMGLERSVRKGSAAHNRYVGLSQLYDDWRASASSRVDPALVAAKNVIQGEDEAEGEVIKQGKRDVNARYKNLAQRAETGEDVSVEIMQMKDDFQSRRLAMHLRSIEAAALADKAHEILGSENIMGEEDGPPESEGSPLDQLMAGKPQQARPLEPSDPFHPSRQKTPAYAMQGRNVVQTDPQQMSAVAQAKNQNREPTPEERMRAIGFEHSILGNKRLWKSFVEAKRYNHYPE